MINPQQTLSSMAKIESIPPKVRNKKRVPTFTATIQHSSGSFGHSNQSRKRNKRNPDWKRRSKTMLNSSGESGCPFLVTDFRGNAFSFLSLKITFAMGLSYMAFTMFRYINYMPAFWRVFIIKKY